MALDIFYNYDARYLCDAGGNSISDLPEIAFNEQPEWVIHPLKNDGTPFLLQKVVAFRAAIDVDFKSDTDVMCRSLPEQIRCSEGAVAVPLDSNTKRFFDVANGREIQPAYFELAGLDASGKRIFYLIFRINARMVLDAGATDDLPEAADLFADRAYVMALIRSGYECQYSLDGAAWTSSSLHAALVRIRNRQAGGEWSDAIPLPRGADGKSFVPDYVDVIANRPATPPDGTCYLATDTRMFYWYRSNAWTQGVVIGKDGRGIASIDKTASAGLEDVYTVTLTDGTTYTYSVINGRDGRNAYDDWLALGNAGTVEDFLEAFRGTPGQDFKADATGEVTEKSAYGNERKGFVFMAAEADASTRSTKIYLWAKKTDDYNDWCNPAVITKYESAREIASIKPIEFKPPTGENASYLHFDLSAYPHATVAAVCIDTAEGELTLPYDSALGIRKIVKTKSKQIQIYFGSSVPAYETGRVYLTQFIGVSDATTDPDVPGLRGKMYYGYISSAIADPVYKVAQITYAMLEAAVTAGTVVKTDAAALGKTAIGTVPAGSLAVVMLPASSSLKAFKFDGIGGKAVFEVNNATVGTGANGADVTLDTTAYKAYGEFVLVTGAMSIYVDAN